MYKRIVILVLILMVVMGAAGCKKNPQQLPEPDGGNQQSEEPQRGGTLVVGSMQEPENLNPILTRTVAASELENLIFSGLVKINDQMRWVPDLALEVPTLENGGVSPDGLIVTYKLRDNVKWHDGEPFTAEDVLFTYKAIMNPKNDVPSMKGYEKIAAVEAPDAYTVVVRYKEVYPAYLSNFPFILPKHLFPNGTDLSKSEFNKKPVGTGPFKLQEWKAGERLLLAANKDYFLGEPYLSQIDYRLIFNSNSLIMKLKTGDIDLVAGGISPDKIERIRQIKNVKGYIKTNLVWEHFDFNLNNPLFKDKAVRQAIAYAIDTQGIVDNILDGAGIATSGSLSPLSWAYKDLPQYERDVDKAKELLAQAGWEDKNKDGIIEKEGEKFIFNSSTTAGDIIRERVQAEIQKQLSEVGIQMNIQNYSSNVLFEDILKNRKYDTIMFAWLLTPDPDQIELWHSAYTPPKGRNFIAYSNEEMDKALEEGHSTLDFAKRQKAYFKMQEILTDDLPVISLYFNANISAANEKLMNYKPNPTFQTNYWNAHEWWLKEDKE